MRLVNLVSKDGNIIFNDWPTSCKQYNINPNLYVIEKMESTLDRSRIDDYDYYDWRTIFNFYDINGNRYILEDTWIDKCIGISTNSNNDGVVLVIRNVYNDKKERYAILNISKNGYSLPYGWFDLKTPMDDLYKHKLFAISKIINGSEKYNFIRIGDNNAILNGKYISDTWFDDAGNPCDYFAIVGLKDKDDNIKYNIINYSDDTHNIQYIWNKEWFNFSTKVILRDHKKTNLSCIC